MDFSDALLLIKHGEKMRRKTWAGNEPLVGGYVELLDINHGIAPMLMMGGFPDGMMRFLFAASQQDILAEDWEIAE